MSKFVIIIGGNITTVEAKETVKEIVDQIESEKSMVAVTKDGGSTWYYNPGAIVYIEGEAIPVKQAEMLPSEIEDIRAIEAKRLENEAVANALRAQEEQQESEAKSNKK